LCCLDLGGWILKCQAGGQSCDPKVQGRQRAGCLNNLETPPDHRVDSIVHALDLLNFVH